MKKIYVLTLTIILLSYLPKTVLAAGSTSIIPIRNPVISLDLRINDPFMIVNGERKELDLGRGTTPIIFEQRALVPIRAIVEELGGSVSWDKQNQKVSIVTPRARIDLTIDQKTIQVNNIEKQLDVAPKIINQRTMLPLRAIVENLGYYINWDSLDARIIITTSMANSIYIDVINTPPGLLEDIVDSSSSLYKYKQMLSDIEKLEDRYKGLITVQSVGKSTLGYNIPTIILGNLAAKKKILIFGSTHGREYMTTQLMMKQLEYYLKNYLTLTMNAKQMSTLLKDVSIHFLPCLNPDGVLLSQSGLSFITDVNLKNKLISINKGSTNFVNWKATITGVNINANFDCDWYKNKATPPSSDGNRGWAPESEPETKAIANYTRSNVFDSVVSYHATGSIIYWYYYQVGSELIRDTNIAKQLAAMTGYSLVPTSANPGYAGFRSWYVRNYKKPAFTIEIGQPGVFPPLPISQFSAIWEKNKMLPIHLANQIGFE